MGGGFAFGGFIGYKRIFPLRLTLEGQVGAQKFVVSATGNAKAETSVGTAETDPKTVSGSAISPILSVRMGWAF